MRGHGEAVFRLISENLRFEFVGAVVGHIPRGRGRTTGWRRLPFHTVAQVLHCRTLLRFPDGRDCAMKDGEAGLALRNAVHRFDTFQCAGPRYTSRFAGFRLPLFGGLDVLDLLDMPPVYPRRVADRIGDLCAALARSSRACGLTNARMPAPHGAGAGAPRSARVRDLATQKALEFQLVSVLTESVSVRPDAARMLLSSERLMRVSREIDAHLERPFTLKEMAKMAGLSPSRFNVLFIEAMGVPPLRHVQHLRMERARLLLLTTDLTVGEIALRVGVEDQFYFSRVFKKASGLSPQQYRQDMSRARLARLDGS
ncbi:MAG: AraC family transcriptional regulator [Kiritimatiellae bacterium]|nr:AraC family transcriptional regulator [Kiritimatiellia bacterium]